jgi:hypothetical protein
MKLDAAAIETVPSQQRPSDREECPTLIFCSGKSYSCWTEYVYLRASIAPGEFFYHMQRIHGHDARLGFTTTHHT